ncbi:MAG: hypothetical protein HY758_00300 [Nitrospirae bacterium]|nr:hypothetical protein [Nitrospirota bacterium]
MYKHIIILLLGIALMPVFFGAGVSSASDRLGCLTCHGYPGFVTPEKAGKFKVLHIDEQKHLSSPHAKVDCRQCHISVNKIPHAEETGVDCTTKCHLNDKNNILTAKSSLSDYHKEEKFAIIKLGDKSSCRACHPLYPHANNVKLRAFINMHSGFLVCQVCHLKKDDFSALTYEWNAPESVEFRGNPYGTFKKHETEEKPDGTNVMTRILKVFSSDDKSQAVKKTVFSISRIAVFSEYQGNNKIILNDEDAARAKEFTEKEKNLNPAAKEKELQYFHKSVVKKEVSMSCEECHSPNGILDLKKLGFTETRINDLQYLNIKHLATRYGVFYLPNLFGH